MQWAEWQHGAGGVGLNGGLVMRYSPREGERAIPINDLAFDRQMLAVDRLVAGLRDVLRDVVIVEYVRGASLTVADRARRCRCGRATYQRRLAAALEDLADGLRRA